MSIAEGAQTFGRRMAESLMVDTVSVTRPGGPPVLDPETGEYVSSVVSVYSGPCRLVMRSTTVSEVDAQSQLQAVQTPRLDVPVAGTAGIRTDDLFELTSGDEAGLSGRIAGLFPQSLKTARRLPVKIGS